MGEWENNSSRPCYFTESACTGDVSQPGFGLDAAATKGDKILTVCCFPAQRGCDAVNKSWEVIMYHYEKLYNNKSVCLVPPL